MKKICVIGSCNIDLVYTVCKMPSQGETINGEDFSENFGGKGANQAIAIAKLGGDVSFFGCVGTDSNGDKLISNFKDNNVNIENVQKVGKTSGTAIIGVCNGNNRIVLIKGANKSVSVEYISKLESKLLQYDIIICQLEIPLETVIYISKYCKNNNKIFILNPAPARKITRRIDRKFNIYYT